MDEFINKAIEIGDTYVGKAVPAIVVTVVGLLLIKAINKAARTIERAYP